MKSVINTIIAILITLTAGAAFGPLYRAVKRETILKVHRGLPPLEGYTRKLTGTKLPY